MTMTVMNPETAAEIDKVTTRLAKATVAYMARLKDIADIGTLAAGAHGYDYAVTVEQSKKLRVLPLLSDLTMSIEDEFGVKITTLAVAGPVRALKSNDPVPQSGEVFSKKRHRVRVPGPVSFTVESKPPRGRKTKTT